MLQARCKWKLSKPAPLFLSYGIIFFTLLGVNVFLQVANDSYDSDFGAHPDEGAHVVTSLMVRDYLAGGFLNSADPLSYARSYYAAFPKVAIGHYPPLFYVVAGGWLLFGVTTQSLLLLSAMITSLCGVMTFILGRAFMGRFPALAAAFLFTLTPLTQQCTSIFMSDMMLLAGCLCSSAAFVRFLKHGRKFDSLLFGALSAATILTKSSGFLLVLLPGFALLLSGKLSLLKNKAIWLAPFVVLLIAVPWTALTYDITSEGAMGDGVGEYFGKSLPFFSTMVVDVCGELVLGLACFQVIYSIVSVAARRRPVTDMESVVVSLCLSGFCFYLLVPAGLEARYLLVITPALLLLAFKFLESICSCISNVLCREPLRRRGMNFMAFLITSACILINCFELKPKEADGFREVIQAVGDSPGDNSRALLVVSDSRGEGALIAASALESSDRPNDAVRVYRGSQRLASSDWMGRNYKPAFRTVDELRGYMISNDFHFLAIDHGVPLKKRAGYHALARQLVNAYPKDFIEFKRFATLRGRTKKSDVMLYRIAVESSG